MAIVELAVELAWDVCSTWWPQPPTMNAEMTHKATRTDVFTDMSGLSPWN
ncbi:hypothetical protein [Nocardia sp. NPDC006630]